VFDNLIILSYVNLIKSMNQARDMLHQIWSNIHTDNHRPGHPALYTDQ